MKDLLTIHKDLKKKPLTKERRVFWAGILEKKLAKRWAETIKALYDRSGFKALRQGGGKGFARSRGCSTSIPEGYDAGQMARERRGHRMPFSA